jgi:hypothetical protein
MNERGWNELDAAVRTAGFEPNECRYESSGLCLDGSRTVTVYSPDGEHIASELIEVEYQAANTPLVGRINHGSFGTSGWELRDDVRPHGRTTLIVWWYAETDLGSAYHEVRLDADGSVEDECGRGMDLAHKKAS